MPEVPGARSVKKKTALLGSTFYNYAEPPLHGRTVAVLSGTPLGANC